MPLEQLNYRERKIKKRLLVIEPEKNIFNVLKKREIINKKKDYITQLEDNLKISKFKQLNEKMYLSKSKDCHNFFKNNIKLFKNYQDGYIDSIKQWKGIKPLDIITKWLKNKDKDLLIADYGCGKAYLAKNVPQKVSSLDFIALNKDIISCDMSNSPLNDESHDIIIFCLSLMTLDYHLCLIDATRVLKIGGTLIIAEAYSRFIIPTRKESFIQMIDAMKSLGYEKVQLKKISELFVIFIFKKINYNRENIDKIKWPVLKINRYKKR